MYSKNDTVVEFPLEGLDLGDHSTVKATREKRSYNLYGIIVTR